MQTTRVYTPRTSTSRLAGAVAATFISIGLLYAVASGFHESKSIQVAKAESHRALVVAGRR